MSTTQSTPQPQRETYVSQQQPAYERPTQQPAYERPTQQVYNADYDDALIAQVLSIA